MNAPPARQVAALAAAVTACALVLRFWTLRDMEAANPLFHFTILDESLYLREARLVRAGEPPTRPSLVSLLWPWMLGKLGIVERHGASVLNVWIGSLAAGLAAAGAARMAGSLLAGAVAGGLCALLAGGLVFQDVTAQIEPLLALLVLAGALAAAAASRSPTWARIACAGAAVGLATLGRGTNVALLAGAIPALRGAGWRTGLARAAVLVLAAAAPVAAFDRAVGAVPTSAGINVWLGNNPFSWESLSFGTAEFPLDPDLEAREARRVPEEAEGRPLTTAEVNAWWVRRTLRAVAAEPGRAALHVLAKAALVLHPDDMGGNHDAVAESEFAGTLRLLPVSAAWLLVAGAAGWVLARRTTAGAGSLGLGTAAFCGALVVVFPLTRYVMPVVPVAAVLAGLGAAAWARGRADASDRRAALITAACGAALCLVASALRAPQRTEAWSNLGEAAMRAGAGDARRLLRLASEADPGNPRPLVLLGNLHLGSGDPEGALPWYERAAKASAGAPRLARFDRGAGIGTADALSALGRHAAALAALDDVRARFPEDPVLAAEGVHISLAAADRSRAERYLDAARAIDPRHPAVLAAAERWDQSR